MNKLHSTKVIPTLILAAVASLVLPATLSAGHYERRFSHYDDCGRPVYVRVYARREYCPPPPPVVRYPRYYHRPPPVVYRDYYRGGHHRPPYGPVGFSFGFYR